MTFSNVVSALSAVVVRKEFITLTGSLEAGILLSQITYWFMPSTKGSSKLRVHRDGKWWLAKTRKDLAAECGLTEYQCKKAIAVLKAQKLIQIEGWMFNGFRTSHVWLDTVQLIAELGQVSPHPSGETRHTGMAKYATPITETTAVDYDSEKHERASPQVQAPVVQVGLVKSQHEVHPHSRKIDNWIADRPGLAEQRLHTEFTGQEWLMKASEILALHREKMQAREVRLTANSLAMAWKRLYSEKYSEFVKDFNKKEMGQMKGFLDKAGGQAPAALEMALADWPRFAYEVKARKGLYKAPERPVVGFLLQYYDVALQLIAGPQPMVDRVETIKHTQSPSTPEAPQEMASMDDVMAALAEFGAKK
jgi:hypothetical protein